MNSSIRDYAYARGWHNMLGTVRHHAVVIRGTVDCSMCSFIMLYVHSMEDSVPAVVVLKLLHG